MIDVNVQANSTPAGQSQDSNVKALTARQLLKPRTDPRHISAKMTSRRILFFFFFCIERKTCPGAYGARIWYVCLCVCPLVNDLQSKVNGGIVVGSQRVRVRMLNTQLIFAITGVSCGRGTKGRLTRVPRSPPFRSVRQRVGFGHLHLHLTTRSPQRRSCACSPPSNDW